MKNVLIEFSSWALVFVAFSLVIASIYQMGGFDWLKF